MAGAVLSKKMRAEEMPAATLATGLPEIGSAGTPLPPATVLDKVLVPCNKSCANIIRAVDKRHRTAATHELETIFFIGDKVEELRRTPALLRPTVGEIAINPVKSIAEVICASVSYVNQMAQCARHYPDPTFRAELMAHRLENGAPLTWPHLRALMPLHSEDGGSNEGFDAMMLRVLRENMSPQQITDALKSQRRQNGEKASRGGGRPLAIPRTFDGLCTRLCKQLEVLNKDVKNIYDSEEYTFVTRLKELSQEGLTERAGAIFERLKTARELMIAALDGLNSVDARLIEAQNFQAQSQQASSEDAGRAAAAVLDAADGDD